MSDPKLYVKFYRSGNLPPGFEMGVDYEVIRTVDAIDTKGRAILNFLITNDHYLIFVPSTSVELSNWLEFNQAIAEQMKLAKASPLLLPSGTPRH